MCQSVITLAATSFISKQETRYHRLLYGFFLDNSRISPKRNRSGEMAIFASLDDRGHILSIEITPAVLDTTKIDVVHEALADHL